jgi:hypothetical protein
MNDDTVNARNPAGIKLSQEQVDESFRGSYWSSAIDYGLQYYVAGRFATANRFTPVCANLLHHAVVLLLKACLSYEDSRATIEKYGYSRGGYGHDIRVLWAAFKKRQLAKVPIEFDAIVVALHSFEDIRYPEKLIQNGARIRINVFVDEPMCGDNDQPEPSYRLSLPSIDRLMGLLFEASHANPSAFLHGIADEHGIGSIYYEKIKTTLFGRTSH